MSRGFSSRCIGLVAVCDCGISRSYSLTFKLAGVLSVHNFRNIVNVNTCIMTFQAVPIKISNKMFQQIVVSIIVFTNTVVPTKSDSDAIVCLQRYQGLKIDRSLVY